jgi:hypothetical protein
METSRARTVWTEQCAATHSIKSRFGVKAALDYLVTEKLLTFADVAASHPEFARELPVFVAEVRRIFAAHEIAEHLAALEHDWAAAADDVAAGGFDDDDINDPPDMVAARAARFATIKDVLLSGQLGIA